MCEAELPLGAFPGERHRHLVASSSCCRRRRPPPGAQAHPRPRGSRPPCRPRWCSSSRRRLVSTPPRNAAWAPGTWSRAARPSGRATLARDAFPRRGAVHVQVRVGSGLATAAGTRRVPRDVAVDTLASPKLKRCTWASGYRRIKEVRLRQVVEFDSRYGPVVVELDGPDVGPGPA
jgi:hypothetical protein